MRKFLGLMVAIILVMGFAMEVWADGYYEFSSFHWSGTDFRGGSDVGSYGNKIYVHNQASVAYEPFNVRTIDVYTMSIPDMSKRDQTPFLVGPDGIYGTGDDVPNPDYQTRTLTYDETVTLGGTEEINNINCSEIYVDERGIFIPGGSDSPYSAIDVLHFGFDGAYLGKEVDASNAGMGTWYGNSISFLGYDSINDIWYGGNEGRKVYSSAGGDWTSEFTWPSMAGGHGDGMEFVRAPDGTGYLYVSDMTSNFIGQWAKGDNPATGAVETGWNEWNRFDYAELMGGTGKYVEGMDFGALGHFWVTSAFWTGESGGSYLYELGGGEIGGYTPDPGPTPPVPEPATMLMFGSGLIGLVGLGRKKFFKKV
ncbi:MAG: PEP-CTERM sorting domain-containing protein [Elusimicrobia bacterium]|nr:PEP-CTERM sorting domain-containing protein [Elusimicrobiota bacterium]